MTALAHTHDPDTSHDAARRLDRETTNRVKSAVLWLLLDGPATVTELRDAYFEMRASMHWPDVDEHTVDKRVTDLKNDGRVVDTGERRLTKRNRPSAVLRLAS
ncbi:hypothetical protein EDF22_0609 [Rathayibacter sp. PhB127]|uniref:hypothetical protein n=1 Tax=Rathayibacter sp. PhB127 TaxID=2485176 RepID=UPI000F4B9FB6|nr:hypothetical protein [Rathayibacter sp. PhB127]ROS28878.1 hypothetical protein EDF22_0609 [Rathayibacter sp. PhB127]